jgi:hypothetical protein
VTNANRSQLRTNLYGKEPKTMRYTKPEVLLLGRAVQAVQMNSKGGDPVDGFDTRTAGAYEADE